MIRKILFATDLGLSTSYVLQHVFALTRRFDAELHVLHVVQPLGLFAESVLQSYLDDGSLIELYDQGLETVMSTIESRVLEGFGEELGDNAHELNLITSVRVMQGDPASVILAEVQRAEIDLIMLGSHSQGLNVLVPLGRTAMRVLQLSDVPVYMVPISQPRPVA